MKSDIKQEQQDLVVEPPVANFESDSDVLKFKKRMLKWSNPVEYVNNMYGCHPGDDPDKGGYFREIFRK